MDCVTKAAAGDPAGGAAPVSPGVAGGGEEELLSGLGLLWRKRERLARGLARIDGTLAEIAAMLEEELGVEERS